MLTKEEFKELKEKYSLSTCEKITLITDYYPKKYFFITGSSQNNKKYLVEVTNKEFNVYNESGKIVKGTYVYRFFTVGNLEIKGDKLKEYLDFFMPTTSLHMFEDGKIFFNKLFINLISELKKYDINTKYCYKFLRKTLTWIRWNENIRFKNVISEAFRLSIKDLRGLSKNYPEDMLYYGYVQGLGKLKKLFGQSAEKIAKYNIVIPFIPNFTLENKSKEELKRLRYLIEYLYKVHEFSRINKENESVFRLYLDYIRMRNFVEVENLSNNYPKYPQDFTKINRLHDELVTIYNREQDRRTAAKNAELQNKYNEKFYKIAKKYEFSNKNYHIIACKDLMDLIKEGRSLNHCVGSYIESVGNGREYILFLRKNDDLEKPFFTIDITPDNKVRQIHGYNNCNITEELKPFIKEWSKKFRLDISNCSGVYCHLWFFNS